MKSTLILIILFCVGFVSCQQKERSGYHADVKILLTTDSTIISDNLKKELSSYQGGDTIFIQASYETFKNAFLTNYPIKKDSIVSQGFGAVIYIRKAVLLRDPYLK